MIYLWLECKGSHENHDQMYYKILYEGFRMYIGAWWGGYTVCQVSAANLPASQAFRAAAGLLESSPSNPIFQLGIWLLHDL